LVAKRNLALNLLSRLAKLFCQTMSPNSNLVKFRLPTATKKRLRALSQSLVCSVGARRFTVVRSYHIVAKVLFSEIATPKK
jgi:hypothetical protein